MSGVSIRQFPKQTDSGDIMELLIMSGLPEAFKDKVIMYNGIVNISNLENSICLTLVDNLHHKKYFGRKLYCNCMIPLTPEKISFNTGSITTASSQSLATSAAVQAHAQTTQAHVPAQITQAQATTVSTLAKIPAV